MKELAKDEFVQKYIQSFKISALVELHNGKPKTQEAESFLEGQINACQSIENNMRLLNKW